MKKLIAGSIIALSQVVLKIHILIVKALKNINNLTCRGVKFESLSRGKKKT